MTNFTLATDSCCDDFKTNLEKLDIPCFSLSYMENDDVFYDNFSRVEDYSSFYDELKQGHCYKTAGANMLEAKEFFEKLIKERQKNIVFISLSSGLSGSYNNLATVANEINETSKFKVFVVDSKSATQGQRLILNLARRFRDMEMEAEEAFKHLNEAIKHLHVYFFVGDISYLRRGGRISMIQAAACKMLQIRPFLKFDEEGKLVIIEKPLGNKKAIKLLLDKCFHDFDTKNNEPIYIAHSCNFESLLDFKTQLENHYGNLNIITGCVGPIIGSHTGPSILAVMFLGKEYIAPKKLEKVERGE